MFNDEFVEAAGFTEAELMGQPHNIIRHPDMPPEAFENLWETLQGRQALGRRGEEPPQERRFLLGAGDRFSDPGEWTDHRLYLDPNQNARRSARGSRTGLRAAAREEGHDYRIDAGIIRRRSPFDRLAMFTRTLRARLITLVAVLGLFMLAIGLAGMHGDARKQYADEVDLRGSRRFRWRSCPRSTTA